MSGRLQSFENHARMVPGYHYVTATLLFVAVIWSVRGLVGGFTMDSLVDLLIVLALLLTAYYARAFAIGVQDRVIRLEERLRLAELLPEDMRPRIGEFTTEQLIALRFASDEELPGLARKVLEGGMTDRKAIKAAVTEWRADHQRI